MYKKTSKNLKGKGDFFKKIGFRGLLNNPFFYFKLKSSFRSGSFYFILLDFVLMGLIFSSCSTFGFSGNSTAKAVFNSFLKNSTEINTIGLFTSQSEAGALETPDLKIFQGNTLGAVSTPSVVSGKVLGAVFGGPSQSNKKEVTDYIVQPGDTLDSIASANNISLNTLLWANELTTTSTIKAGQTLVILPADGVLHAVKSGDTISAIAGNYKSNQGEIISFNNLASQDDIYIGDVLIVPGGILPKKAAPVVNNRIPLADNFFIFPTQGRITQRLHYYNAVDVANKCGTPIYAAAAGTVQRAVGNGGWNNGMGNHVTILHSNGTVTYYGHLMSLSVRPGDKVYTGQAIGLMGGQPGMAGAGKSTGCHVHFQVIGATNPLAGYNLGATINYK